MFRGSDLNELARGAKTATVVVPEDQLSLAIGRDGQNARLAAKLTAWRIDIKSLPEAVSDLLNKLRNDPFYMPFAEKEADLLPQIEDVMVKKSQGRPVTPEEYQLLNQLVDRVERAVLEARQKELKAAAAEEQAVADSIPNEAFEAPIEELNISQRICTLLRENEINTIGDLMLQMRLDPDRILALQGIGPKAMEDIQSALASVTFAEPTTEVAEQVEAEVVAAEIEPEAAVVEMAELAEAAIPLEAEEMVAEAAEAVLAAEAVSVEEHVPATEVEVSAEAGAEVEELVAQEETAPAVTVDEEIAERPLDELFEIKPEIFDFEIETDEEEDEEYRDRKGKPTKRKKKKKKKFVEVEYDPEQDVVIVKKIHKRGDDLWEDIEA